MWTCVGNNIYKYTLSKTSQVTCPPKKLPWARSRDGHEPDARPGKSAAQNTDSDCDTRLKEEQCPEPSSGRGDGHRPDQLGGISSGTLGHEHRTAPHHRLL